MDLRRVLLVEDEPIIRLALALELEDSGYSVIEAGNALEALVAIGSHKIDAVVTDIDMPGGKNGLDLARTVAALDGTITLILVSGGTTPKSEDLPAGAFFMAKPYSFSEIVTVLKQELSTRSVMVLALNKDRRHA